jgi:protein-disulfide isomerase
MHTLPIEEQERLLGPGSPASARTRVLVAPDDPMLGAVYAPLTLVEFSDLSVTPARLAAPTIRALRADYGDRLRVVFKPIVDPSSAISLTAGLGAIAATEQGLFWPYYDCMTGLDHDPTPEDIAGCAALTGADLDRFSAAMQDEGAYAQLDAANAYARRVGVQGTPTFFLNGYRIDGAYPLESFQSGLAAEARTVESLRERHRISNGEVYALVMRGARAATQVTTDGDAGECAP